MIAWSSETRRWNATWAALIVVAVVAWMLGAWLLPALGIEPATGLHFFPEQRKVLKPEPLEQQRFLLAIVAALAVAPLSVLIARRRALDPVTRFAPPVGLLGVVGVIVASLARDHVALETWLPLLTAPKAIGILVVAALVVWLATRSAGGVRAVRRADAALRTRPGEGAAFLVAFLLAAGVASVGLYTDNNVTLSPQQTWGHMPFTFEDVYAVTLGRTPLVDYTPQYSTLLSWVAAPLLLLRPPSIGIFTALMASLTTLTLACLYLTFRMVTGGGGRALLLYVPALGIGFVPAIILADDRQVHTIAAYFAGMPLRYSGPLVLLMACVWAAGRPESRRRIGLVGVAAAAGFLMNPEFGVFAGAAAVLATLLAVREEGPWRRAAVLGALRDLAMGAVAFLALFALATLIRSGSLPNPATLVYFNRQFAAAGFFLDPLDHLLGFHVLVFGTCAAAAIAGIGMALSGTIRPGVEGRRSAVLLIYAGVFGFGAFTYFMGRSLPGVLGSTFVGWSVALAALAWEAARRLQAGGVSARAVAPAAVALLAGAVLVGTGGINRLGYIFDQPSRIADDATNNPALRMVAATRAARQCLRPGSDTMIFAAMPDRIADVAGVRNWLPYNDPLSVVTEEQLDEVFKALRRHDVQAILVENAPPEARARLQREGWVRRATFPNPAWVPEQPLSWGRAVAIFSRPGAASATTCGA